ncbi:MAG: ribonuclease Y [Candidatus Zambryskibacteria bacterium]|nr:ribonuclease Y [Candidatus Zambryskibacteria bacterium]
MSLKLALLLALLAASAGIGFGYLLRLIISLGRKGSVELDIKRLELEAKEEAQRIVSEAEARAEAFLERNKKTEDRLVKKEELLDKRQMDLDKEAEFAKSRIAEARSLRERAEELVRERANELSKISGLSVDGAKEELFKTLEKEFEKDLLVRIQKLESDGKERFDDKARDILAVTIQRLAMSVSGEMMTTTITLPSDDVKGKIIGKEGRNIKAFERATGVEVIVDDTPNSITLSSFDSVRRAVAKLALENLVADGRIQPVRIEEFISLAEADVNKIIKEKGEEAAVECGVFNLDSKLLLLLGRLHFRTSFGQNVLRHSVEMAHLAGMIAEEVGANVATAKAGALLHDIGKAIDHEVPGTHVEIGRKILAKFHVSEEIIQAMQSHHEEYPYATVESVIVQTADAISGGRPGARRDTAERYSKRLEDLEAIALSFEGVEKAYALQAGREVRVFVTPDKISDIEARKLARDIALRVENELKYPGEIKVNVIRESRAIEFAR